MPFLERILHVIEAIMFIPIRCTLICSDNIRSALAPAPRRATKTFFRGDSYV